MQEVRQGKGTGGAGTPATRLALLLLLRAFEDAARLRRDVWQFAVELQTLTDAGSTTVDLRQLVGAGFAEHAVERTRRGCKRVFRKLRNLSIPAETCFVLTGSGAALAQELLADFKANTHAESAGRLPESPVIGPYFDRLRRELRFDGMLVKRFRQPAECQIAVLLNFHEQHWYQRIDNPLRSTDEADAQQRLHNTIKQLNRNQGFRLIRFFGDGTGDGVCWEPANGRLREATPERPQRSP